MWRTLGTARDHSVYSRCCAGSCRLLDVKYHQPMGQSRVQGLGVGEGQCGGEEREMVLRDEWVPPGGLRRVRYPRILGARCPNLYHASLKVNYVGPFDFRVGRGRRGVAT